VSAPLALAMELWSCRVTMMVNPSWLHHWTRMVMMVNPWSCQTMMIGVMPCSGRVAVARAH